MDTPFHEDKSTRRKHEVITYKTDNIHSSSSLRIEIPRLSENICMIPNTLNLIVKLESTNTKAWFLNNIGKLLCKRLQI
jgi:hypothetical protein